MVVLEVGLHAARDYGHPMFQQSHEQRGVVKR